MVLVVLCYRLVTVLRSGASSGRGFGTKNTSGSLAYRRLISERRRAAEERARVEATSNFSSVSGEQEFVNPQGEVSGGSSPVANFSVNVPTRNPTVANVGAPTFINSSSGGGLSSINDGGGSVIRGTIEPLPVSAPARSFLRGVKQGFFDFGGSMQELRAGTPSTSGQFGLTVGLGGGLLLARAGGEATGYVSTKVVQGVGRIASRGNRVLGLVADTDRGLRAASATNTAFNVGGVLTTAGVYSVSTPNQRAGLIISSGPFLSGAQAGSLRAGSIGYQPEAVVGITRSNLVVRNTPTGSLSATGQQDVLVKGKLFGRNALSTGTTTVNLAGSGRGPGVSDVSGASVTSINVPLSKSGRNVLLARDISGTVNTRDNFALLGTSNNEVIGVRQSKPVSLIEDNTGRLETSNTLTAIRSGRTGNLIRETGSVGVSESISYARYQPTISGRELVGVSGQEGYSYSLINSRSLRLGKDVSVLKGLSGRAPVRSVSGGRVPRGDNSLLSGRRAQLSLVGNNVLVATSIQRTGTRTGSGSVLGGVDYTPTFTRGVNRRSQLLGLSSGFSSLSGRNSVFSGLGRGTTQSTGSGVGLDNGLISGSSVTPKTKTNLFGGTISGSVPQSRQTIISGLLGGGVSIPTTTRGGGGSSGLFGGGLVAPLFGSSPPTKSKKNSGRGFAFAPSLVGLTPKGSKGVGPSTPLLTGLEVRSGRKKLFTR